METAAIIAGGVILLVLVITLIGSVAGRAATRSSNERIEELGAGGLRQGPALSLGVTSAGKGQVRGNGTLALGETELTFVLAVPRRETRIPLPAITEVGTKRSHLGKSIGYRLLFVAWDSPDGPDSIALQVRGLDGWIAAIDAARSA